MVAESSKNSPKHIVLTYNSPTKKLKRNWSLTESYKVLEKIKNNNNNNSPNNSNKKNTNFPFPNENKEEEEENDDQFEEIDKVDFGEMPDYRKNI
jgi:hypothetical protein